MIIKQLTLNTYYGEQDDLQVGYTINLEEGWFSQASSYALSWYNKKQYIDDEEIRLLQKKLAAINIFDWQAEYQGFALHGHSWELTIEAFDGGIYVKKGHHCWPDNWKELIIVCRGLQDLVQ